MLLAYFLFLPWYQCWYILVSWLLNFYLFFVIWLNEWGKTEPTWENISVNSIKTSVSLSNCLKTQVIKVYDGIHLHSSLCSGETVFLNRREKKSTACKQERLKLNYCQKRMNLYLERILKTYFWTCISNIFLLLFFSHQLRPYFALFNMHYADNFSFFLILFYYVPWMWKRKRWTPWSKRIQDHDVGRNKDSVEEWVWQSVSYIWSQKCGLFVDANNPSIVN